MAPKRNWTRDYLRVNSKSDQLSYSSWFLRGDFGSYKNEYVYYDNLMFYF